MGSLHGLPTDVLYRITAYLDVYSQRHFFMSSKVLYDKWLIQVEQTQEHRFLLWCLEWLEQRNRTVFDATRTGVTVHYIQQRFRADHTLHPDFFMTSRSFIESMAVITRQGLAFPCLKVDVSPTHSEGTLWRELESGIVVPGFGLVRYLRRPVPCVPWDTERVVFTAQCSKAQLLRRMTAALAAQCSVLHLMALTSRHDHLLQATEECFALLCSRTWSRGQIILYLEPSSNLHIVIDLNADGSWAVDDHKSRNTPIVLDFNHMPGSIAEVRAFFYSPSAMRFVDESEHDDCLCRAATDWDEDSKLFIYNQNISPVQH